MVSYSLEKSKFIIDALRFIENDGITLLSVGDLSTLKEYTKWRKMTNVIFKGFVELVFVLK